MSTFGTTSIQDLNEDNKLDEALEKMAEEYGELLREKEKKEKQKNEEKEYMYFPEENFF